MKKVLRWLDNYWYHYKWITIGVVLFAAIIIIMGVQYVVKDEYDISLIYAGPVTPTAIQVREIENSFDTIVKEDYNGDGDANSEFIGFFLLTEKQITASEEAAAERNEFFYANATELANTRESFTTHVFAGESLICMLDPYWYELLAGQEAFVPLGEILGEAPEYAVDDCAVRLRDTPFGRYYTSLGALPSDTLLCFRKRSTAVMKNPEREEKRYEFNKSVFRAMFEFAPDDTR